MALREQIENLRELLLEYQATSKAKYYEAAGVDDVESASRLAEACTLNVCISQLNDILDANDDGDP
jgi:hypothetical protein